MSTAIEHSVETVHQTVEEPLFRVVMINDDYTPMDFVIGVLMEVFSLSEAAAEKITMQIHHEGRGVCGVFQREIAEAKVFKVEAIATGNGHPLLCIMEKDE